tara:strand:+ start:26785 stop:28665 length:1881 start_codon:yes stop_codon:yes gene_type:complete
MTFRFLPTTIVFLIAIGLGQVGWAGSPPESQVSEADREHWSFKELKSPTVPEVEDGKSVRNPIDRFILAKLEASGLKLSPQADNATLARRLAFDLTGMPPKPEDLAEFLANPTDEYYESYVETLLSSPAYGERWAQHWLDLVRFAETDGFEHDATREKAWLYRDWVIEALNRDLPVNEFVTLQIAGDEVCDGDDWQRLGTGFLVAGPDMPDLNSQDERRHLVLNEITSTVGTAFLGLTMKCAECHDHPYDPINQAAFYRLRSFFDNAVHPEGGASLGHVVAEAGNRPPRSFIYDRGNYREPTEEVAPWFPKVANPKWHRPPPLLETMTPTSTGRRTALAAWLTADDNPLFLRSMVNRIWQHHFQQPLAGTPNDLGRNGMAPSHPELLDWLAMELPKRHWSFKEMHRLIVTSSTYRQSSLSNAGEWEKSMEIDPGNELFWRYPRWQLSGEAIRDSVLAISGDLTDKIGGESVHLPLPMEVEVTLLKKHRSEPSSDEDRRRRSIYVFNRRNLGHPMFDVYGRPDRQTSCGMRTNATTPTQALTQLNSDLMRQASSRIAEQIANEFQNGSEAWVEQAFLRILSRPPTEREMLTCLGFFTTYEQRTGSNQNLLTDFCLALLNSNAFLYVE